MNNDALYKISYGLFVLTAHTSSGKDNGCIINTALQVTAEPMQLGMCISKANYTHDIIADIKAFAISVINQNADFELFKHFGFQSGKDIDKFADFTDCKRTSDGLLYITKGTNAYISAKVNKSVDLGSHTMFIGKINDMEILNDVPSVTYDYYLDRIKPQQSTRATGKTVWRCKICGYEYEGESLPKDYICPLCKHPASDFEKISS